MEIDTIENRISLKDKVYYSYGKKGHLKKNHQAKIIEETDYYLEVFKEVLEKNIPFKKNAAYYPRPLILKPKEILKLYWKLYNILYYITTILEVHVGTKVAIALISP